MAFLKPWTMTGLHYNILQGQPTIILGKVSENLDLPPELLLNDSARDMSDLF
jgi:hypothetical protein